MESHTRMFTVEIGEQLDVFLICFVVYLIVFLVEAKKVVEGAAAMVLQSVLLLVTDLPRSLQLATVLPKTPNLRMAPLTNQATELLSQDMDLLDQTLVLLLQDLLLRDLQHLDLHVQDPHRKDQDLLPHHDKDHEDHKSQIREAMVVPGHLNKLLLDMVDPKFLINRITAEANRLPGNLIIWTAMDHLKLLL